MNIFSNNFGEKHKFSIKEVMDKRKGSLVEEFGSFKM
jgi:hypothetical protein